MELRPLTLHPVPVAPGWPVRLPLFSSRVRAGFPSPADDDIEAVLSLDDLVRATPAATFFLRVEGDSMTDARIHDGDVLVVDRACEVSDGSLVIAAVDGQLTVKRLRVNGRGTAARVALWPEAAGFAPIEVGPEQDFVVWGVVTFVLHEVR